MTWSDGATGYCRFDFLKVRNPYRWLPDADDGDIHDKKTVGTEPRRNFLKSDVSSSASLADLYIYPILTTTHSFNGEGLIFTL